MIRKSSTGDATELVWFKSTYSSGPDGDSCVEIAQGPATIHVRDSKSTDGPRLKLTPMAWKHFMTYASAAGCHRG